MKPQDLDALVADILGEHLARFRDEIERLIAAKPVPPFVPPAVWVDGRHAAGVSVRHRNGLFYARRDTTDEPPSDAWLPLLVGIAGADFRWTDDRTMTLMVSLSDGTIVSTQREFIVPIARGFWQADVAYREGDRVLRFGDWQCAKDCTGIDPNGDANDGQWLRVNGKAGRSVSFRLDDDGTLYESGREIGSIKPLVAHLLRDLTGHLVPA
jgi:hypothetical protein